MVLALSPMGVMAAETDAAQEDAVVMQEESAAGQSTSAEESSTEAVEAAGEGIVLQDGPAAEEESVLQGQTAVEENSTAESEDQVAASTAASGTCGDHVTWKLKDGVLTISGSGQMEDYLFYGDGVTSPFYDRTDIKKIVIQNGVTSIGANAFSGCTSLKSVTIPDSVTSIGRYAFYFCISLKSVTIPNSVTSINESVFEKCTSLKSVTIPDSVTSIDSYAFLRCTSLKSVTIGKSVTYIDLSAFRNCTSLKSVTIPDSVTYIGLDVFANCTSLTSVTIGKSVTYIGNGAFFDCTSLTSVTIGKSVKRIDDAAFGNCYSLKDVYYSGTQSEWKKMEIGSDNDSLLKAKIHYGWKNEVAVTGVMLSKSSLSMIAGKTATLTATVVPANATNKSITWKSSNPRVVTVDSAGRLTAVTIGTATITATSSNGKSASCKVTVSFADVPAKAYYAAPVSWAAAKGITSGVSKASFAPDQICKREQIVTFLYRAAGSPKVSGSLPFTDVKKGSYYYNAVLWAVKNKITSGTSATKFSPAAPCTRGQIVTFLWRYKKTPKVAASGKFKDVSQKAYYAAAVNWAVKSKVTSGKTATTFGPNDPCTRAHAVTFLYRAK